MSKCPQVEIMELREQLAECEAESYALSQQLAAIQTETVSLRADNLRLQEEVDEKGMSRMQGEWTGPDRRQPSTEPKE